MSREFIARKIKERLLIAVEFDGYHSENPVSSYDAFKDCNLLQSFSEFESQINELSRLDVDNAHYLKGVREQLDVITGEINGFAKSLMRSASVTETNIEKVSDKVFDSLARQFEMRNKKILRVVSPHPWIG